MLSYCWSSAAVLEVQFPTWKMMCGLLQVRPNVHSRHSWNIQQPGQGYPHNSSKKSSCCCCWWWLVVVVVVNVLLLLYNDRNISENRGYVSLLSWHHHWGFYMMPILNPIHGWMIIPFYGKIITALINAHSPHRHPNGLIVWSQCFSVSIVVSEIWLKHVKTCYPLVFLHSYGKWPMYRWFMIIYLLKSVIFHGFIAAD